MLLKTFYIFRHGETDWNAQGLFQGHTDIPLNEKGMAQATELQPLLSALHPEIIFCSDLIRAQQTASLANARVRSPVIISHKLREINIGDYEGVHRDKVKEGLGELGWQRWISAHPKDIDFAFPNGESKAQVFSRVSSYLTNIAKNFDYQTIAISTHGGVIKRIMHGIEDLTDEQVPIKNCCLYEIQYEVHTGRWKFIGLKN